jgi:hypothetical protein
MSTAQAPQQSPVPLAPPEEEFWERYSPHHEFPLSSVGSVALHIAGVVLFILALWLLSKLSFSDKTPVPMTVISLASDGTGEPGRGGGGGGETRPENIGEQSIPKKRNVPQAEIDKVIPVL